jgi:hypothetical protein
MGVGPHGQNAREFGFMVEAGMNSREAIKAATVNAAKLLTFPTQRRVCELSVPREMVAIVTGAARGCRRSYPWPRFRFRSRLRKAARRVPFFWTQQRVHIAGRGDGQCWPLAQIPGKQNDNSAVRPARPPPLPHVGRFALGPIERDRGFADSPLEGDGFELPVREHRAMAPSHGFAAASHREAALRGAPASRVPRRSEVP